MLLETVLYLTIETLLISDIKGVYIMTLRTCFQKEAGLAYFSAYAASYNEIPVIQVMKDVQHYCNYYLM